MLLVANSLEALSYSAASNWMRWLERLRRQQWIPGSQGKDSCRTDFGSKDAQIAQIYTIHFEKYCWFVSFVHLGDKDSAWERVWWLVTKTKKNSDNLHGF